MIWVALALTGVLTLIIGFLALTPVTPTPGLPTNDKVQHILAFAGLILPTAILAQRLLIWTIPFCVGYGLAIELIQPHIGRQGEIGDFLADLAGLICGIIAGLMLKKAVTVLRGGTKANLPSVSNRQAR